MAGKAYRQNRDAFGACFAQNLVRARKRAGLSQEELAFRTCLHRTEIGQLEARQRMPRLDTAAKLAGALGVGLGDLVAGVRWIAPEIGGGWFEHAIDDADKPAKN